MTESAFQRRIDHGVVKQFDGSPLNAFITSPLQSVTSPPSAKVSQISYFGADEENKRRHGAEHGFAHDDRSFFQEPVQSVENGDVWAMDRRRDLGDRSHTFGS